MEVMRNFDFNILGIWINGDWDRSCFGDDSFHVLRSGVEEIVRSSNSGVAGKRNFRHRGEDVYFAFAGSSSFFWEMEEDDFGEVEFGGDELFLLLSKGCRCRCRNPDNRNWVSDVRRGCEYIKGCK